MIESLNEIKKMRRIGVLTSGGDAPGMNAAIRAVVRTCMANDVKAVGIYNGYQGLINSDVVELDARSVNRITGEGGTILYTARCDEFKTPEGLQRGVQSCKYLGIDGLVAIGGDGTFRGAQSLANAGINTVAIPGTIDNDIACTSYTIGFDTAANTAIDAVDKLADTMRSHQRTSVVEVMGRHAGHLALYIGISVGATAILVPESKLDFEKDVIEKIREGRYNNKNHFIIIVAEGVGDTMGIADRLYKETGIETRVTTLGHVQRGGRPTARDRAMASRMGHYAVELLLKGATNRVVCYRESKITDLDINEALSKHKGLDEYTFRVASEIGI